MEFNLKKHGGSAHRPHSFIQLTVSSSQGFITEDVTNLNGHVSADLIYQLRSIADELEEQNRLVKEQSQSNP